MAFKEVELDNVGIIRLYKRRGGSSIRMSFDSSGAVRVSQPAWLPYEEGLKFVKERIDWIKTHQPEPVKLFENGDRVGKAHRLELVESKIVKTVTGRVKDNVIKVTYPVSQNSQSTDVQKKIVATAKKALKLEASKLLPQKLNELSIKYDLNYKSVAIKELKAKWGSCSQNKDITLNYYLMQLPWELIDYVLMHELVHTEHMNHGHDFWNKFEQILPNAKQVRKQLKTFKTAVVTKT